MTAKVSAGEARGSGVALLPEVPKCSSKGKRRVRQKVHGECARNSAEPQVEIAGATRLEASPSLAAALQCRQKRTGAAAACKEQEGPSSANGPLTQHCQAPKPSACGAQEASLSVEHRVGPRQEATSGLPGCGEDGSACKPNDESAVVGHEPLRRSRPRRRASIGVAELLQAMREAAEKPAPRKRRRGVAALQHKAAATRQLDDVDASECPDEDDASCRAPVRKPRLGDPAACAITLVVEFSTLVTR